MITFKTIYRGKVLDLTLLYLDEINFGLGDKGEITAFCYIRNELVSVTEFRLQDVISAQAEIDTSINFLSIMESFVITKKLGI